MSGRVPVSEATGETRSPQERTDAAVRLVLATLEQDEAQVLDIVGDELGGDDKLEQALFVVEVAKVASALGGRLDRREHLSAPLAEVLRAMLDGTAQGIFRAAAHVTRPPQRTRKGRRAANKKRG